ncbi:MAG: cytochrome c biogenesis protein CcsA [Deltaproteobacteria bacterium]|nr:cytochrome c biogenesis protein CcsA [Deltaproteobacteria bacterium]
MGMIFFKIALVAYFVSTVGYVSSLFVGRVKVAKLSMWVFSLAFALHTVCIVIQWTGVASIPSANIYGSLSFIAWAISGAYLAFQTKTKTRVLGAFVSPAILVMMIAASSGLMCGVSIPPALRGPWVIVHVLLLLTGGALFALACLAGAMYLLQDNLIKSKKVSGFSRMFPSLRDLDRINHICIVWGFPLLTFGIIAGSIWAWTVWGSSWYWDPKQIFTAVSWVIYAILVHQRIVIGWSGRKAAVLSIVAFAGLLFAFIGVNVFFVTIHNF